MALLLCNELVIRSKVFRKMVADQFQLFITCTIVGGAPPKNEKSEPRGFDHPNKNRFVL